MINIAGEVHAIERRGLTRCGQRYPASWRTCRNNITCPACLRIRDAELEAIRAKAGEWVNSTGQDIPF